MRLRLTAVELVPRRAGPVLILVLAFGIEFLSAPPSLDLFSSSLACLVRCLPVVQKIDGVVVAGVCASCRVGWWPKGIQFVGRAMTVQRQGVAQPLAQRRTGERAAAVSVWETVSILDSQSNVGIIVFNMIGTVTCTHNPSTTRNVEPCCEMIFVDFVIAGGNARTPS